MKALILRQDPDASHAISRALMDKGFQILCVEKLDVAHALIRVDTIDLLVMDERIDGQLTHAIALSGERKNPCLSAIFMTDRPGEQTEDLYALIPSLYALVGMEVDAKLVAKLALSAVSNIEDLMARIAAQNAQEAEDATDAAEAGMPALVLDQAMKATVYPSEQEGDPALADMVFASPAMEELRQTPSAQLPQPINDVIIAEVAAIFRDGAFPTPEMDRDDDEARTADAPAFVAPRPAPMPIAEVLGTAV